MWAPFYPADGLAFLVAIAAANAAPPEPTGKTHAEAAQAIRPQPKRLPAVVSPTSFVVSLQRRSVLRFGSLANQGIVVYIMLLVSRSVPLNTIRPRPVGNTSAETSECIPGSEACSSAEPPPTRR